MSDADPGDEFDVVFDSAAVPRWQSWSPGVALPLTFVLMAVALVLEPQARWLAAGYIVVTSALWLWDPFSFWVRGEAPLIEMSDHQVRVTMRGTARTEPVDHFQLVEVDPGAGWVLTKDATFASLRFVWKPEHAPGVEGFVKDEWWYVRLPLRDRRRRTVLREVAAAIARHGLAVEFDDTHPRERFEPIVEGPG